MSLEEYVQKYDDGTIVAAINKTIINHITENNTIDIFIDDFVGRIEKVVDNYAYLDDGSNVRSKFREDIKKAIFNIEQKI